MYVHMCVCLYTLLMFQLLDREQNRCELLVERDSWRDRIKSGELLEDCHSKEEGEESLAVQA